MKKFTEIDQFRSVVRAVRSRHDYQGKNGNDESIYAHTSPYPTLKFRGTNKIHGTNSAIVKYDDGRIEFQSRERVLSLDEDNSNFMREMSGKNYDKLFTTIEDSGLVFTNYCAIYGEWCGKGIQKKVAVSELVKTFIIFAVKIDGKYVNLDRIPNLMINEENIYNILQFPTYEIEIDFNQPELIQNTLVEITNEVEKECPVGKYFGVSGVGEGVVWECFIGEEERFIFKVKGEKHQNSRVKTLTTVNVEEIENIKKFVDYAVTENRLLQGIDKMKELNKPIEPQTTGDYLRWVYNDVIKEEMDTIQTNNIDMKKIGSAISGKARIFWLNYLNNNF